MYKDINLLDFPETTRNKYINRLMEILFTEQERNNGILLLPNAKTSSKREPLDNERIQHLKSKFFFSLILIQTLLNLRLFIKRCVCDKIRNHTMEKKCCIG